MSALEQSREWGTVDCLRWRGAIFTRLPSLAEDLAAGFLHVAIRYGNAAGNRWLTRQTADLLEPTQVYKRFPVIADDLKRAFIAKRNAESTTIEGIKAACQWLQDAESRLKIGSLNVTHDDDALVDYAQAQARAVEDARNKLIGNIAEHNRRQRLGLLPPARRIRQPRGGSLSEQSRDMARQIAEARNPLTPPPAGIPLMAVFAWHRAPLMSLAVADELAAAAARKRATLHSITPPPVKQPASMQLARLSCESFWRRKLRRLAGRRLEQVQREAYRVHAQAGIYCSDLTIERRRAQRVRNRTLLEAFEAINQEGQVYTLAELAELGLSNPDHRRAELMLRIRDTEVEARRLGHVGMFYTVTAPSRFHPVNANRYKDRKGRERYRCRRNPKYDGSTPREAQQHIQKVWAKARAKLSRDERAIYGIRVVEPHHDGTPHWHLLIWMKPEDAEAITETLRGYAEEESPEELYNSLGKTTARFDAKRIDHDKGTAAGYVAKYISKNINGEQFTRAGVEGDELDRYGHDLNSAAPRIEAWAACWGIRQFQFVGLPSVTVWREIRRLTDQQESQLREWEAATRPHPRAAATFHQIREAANAGQWDRFLRLMGGPNTPRKLQPIKPWSIPAFRTDQGDDDFSHATGERRTEFLERGRYGDEIKVPKGLAVSDGKGRVSEYLTRLYRWNVRPKRAAAKGFSGGGEAADPWTCVTNCTDPGTGTGQSLIPRRILTPKELTPAELTEQTRRYQEWRGSEAVRAEMEAVELEERHIRAAARRHAPRPEWHGIEEFFPDGI
ncbi:replication endonuclease [Salinicola avicenniae]|uniref:replication endonuclease n=1 Tax=Salinicola avicenniae TaxID=2916836 RepID=UPI002073B72E|nr:MULTISPECIES: replication endonuclease [unclassified Salinicola]